MRPAPDLQPAQAASGVPVPREPHLSLRRAHAMRFVRRSLRSALCSLNAELNL